jgi:hypothetical protein
LRIIVVIEGIEKPLEFLSHPLAQLEIIRFVEKFLDVFPLGTRFRAQHAVWVWVL